MPNQKDCFGPLLGQWVQCKVVQKNNMSSGNQRLEKETNESEGQAGHRSVCVGASEGEGHNGQQFHTYDAAKHSLAPNPSTNQHTPSEGNRPLLQNSSDTAHNPVTCEGSNAAYSSNMHQTPRGDVTVHTYTSSTDRDAEQSEGSFDVGVNHLHPNNIPFTTVRGRGRGGNKSRGGRQHRQLTANIPEPSELENEYKNNRQRRNKQTKIKRLLLTNSNQQNNHFTKYYSVKFPRLDLDAKLNVIATDKDLKAKIGNPAMIKKQNKDTLLIEVKSDAQGSKLKNITALHGQPVEVAEHKTLNTCKGTVYSETMSNSSLEELQDALEDQQVSKVERMKRWVNGVLKDTHRHIITFKKPDLPQVIKITDWHHELIDLFIPNPMRCMNCKRLGHTKKWCRRTSPTCPKCAEEHHPALGCDKPLKCVNCSEEHNALERKCPFYPFKCEILATQTRFPE